MRVRTSRGALCACVCVCDPKVQACKTLWARVQRANDVCRWVVCALIQRVLKCPTGDNDGQKLQQKKRRWKEWLKIAAFWSGWVKSMRNLLSYSIMHSELVGKWKFSWKCVDLTFTFPRSPFLSGDNHGAERPTDDCEKCKLRNVSRTRGINFC